MFRFSRRSLKNLSGVHPDLVRIMRHALEITDIDFAVTEGLRTLERQDALLNAGASQTLNSRHLTGHAVDVAVIIGGDIRWDWPLYDRLSIYIKAAADDCHLPIEWGGDWKSFKDGCHYQLPWKEYP